jgi:uncharacterized repeat protein (TIGR03803 family)
MCSYLRDTTLEGGDGALYGTTGEGGSNDLGTVFKLNKDGSGYAVLRSFRFMSRDGYRPHGLVEGCDGLLYGTTAGYAGTVFKLNKDGSDYAVLHSFGSITGDGSFPNGLVRGKDGALYGTTLSGGDMGFLGTVFKLFSSAPIISVTGIELNGAGALLSLSGGAAGQPYSIQATTNLNTTNGWQALGSTKARIDGRFQFLDPGASNQPARFYRSAKP